nr:hypothetical protein GCM10020093_047120 [Planobispora longispora]
MTEDLLRAEVAAERREQADLLAGLRPEQWDAPTLCDGWRVREVVAHTTMPFRTSLRRTLAELVKARGDINRMADRCARRDAAELPPEKLLASLRDNVAHPWTLPAEASGGALARRHPRTRHHGGAGPRPPGPPERVAVVLAGMRPKNLAFFGTDLTGSRCGRPTSTGVTVRGHRSAASRRTSCSSCADGACRRAASTARPPRGSPGGPGVTGKRRDPVRSR